MGILKTCGSFTELKKPEMVFKCFIRFVLAQAAVTHGMELMTALFKIAQGMISTINPRFSRLRSHFILSYFHSIKNLLIK